MPEAIDTIEEKPLDTGIENVETNNNPSGVTEIKHPNTDLDARLDELAGRKPNEALKTSTQESVSKGQATNTGDKSKAAQAQPTTQEQRPNSESRRQTYSPRPYPKSYKSDVNGNVVDAATGAIIATAGGHRTAFEKMLPYIESVRSEAEKYKVALEAANTANSTAASLGLSPDQYLLGAKIMKAWNANPKEAIKYLLTEAQANDIDVSDIVAGGAGLSPTMLKQLIKEELSTVIKPFSRFVERDDEEQQRRESHQRAEQGVNQLLAEYPDAELHGVHIAGIMRHHLEQGQDISMREAYLILQNHALKNGLDFTKDLTPQVQAKMNNGTRTTAPNVDTTRRALPQMSGNQGNGSIIPKPPAKADGLASSDDIVKEAMRQAGIQI